jgi:hypothetical protein
MHKAYKCLDHSMGCTYIFCVVIFDEVFFFLFATPGVTADVSTLEKFISFPSIELDTSVHVPNYDMSYLSTNPPCQHSDVLLCKKSCV